MFSEPEAPEARWCSSLAKGFGRQRSGPKLRMLTEKRPRAAPGARWCSSPAKVCLSRFPLPSLCRCPRQQPISWRTAKPTPKRTPWSPPSQRLRIPSERNGSSASCCEPRRTPPQFLSPPPSVRSPSPEGKKWNFMGRGWHEHPGSPQFFNHSFI